MQRKKLLTGFIEELKQRWINEILAFHGDYITGLEDLTAGSDPSWVFYMVAKRYGRALCCEADATQLLKEIILRRRLNPVIRSVAGLFMDHKQVFEDRNLLLSGNRGGALPDPSVELPKEPVIWIANHAFKDDIAASIVAAKRHAYVMFASLPQFYNVIDGLAAYMNGLVLLNRKVPTSKHQAVKKAIEVLRCGADLIIFPEGVWNKTSEKLVLDFWPGVYRISK